MHRELVNRLVCPGTGASLSVRDENSESPVGEVSTGELVGGERLYPIVGGIPRFVPSAEYASSFSSQWKRWATTQLDSVNGSGVFRSRFERYIGDPAGLEGLSVLDAGCGAGAFLDVVAPHAGSVVGVDLSDSVEAAHAALGSRPNVDVIQGDLLALPFPDGAFDFVFCIGVIQHTPDPEATFRSLVRVVRPGGTLAVWIYERKRYELLKPKHILRRYTAGMPPERAMPFVERYCRAARPVRSFLRRLPGGQALSRLVPVSDLGGYAGNLLERISPQEVEEWELMDTHDMLITTYDQPQRPADVADWFRRAGMQPFRSWDAEAIAMQATKPGPA